LIILIPAIINYNKVAYKIANIQTDSTAIAFNLFESVKNVFDLKSSKD